MKLYADRVFYHLELHQSETKLPYLILFHGFMGSGESFKALLSGLKAFCNPVTIDLIGHGKTETPDKIELFKTDRQVQQITSILDRLKFDRLFAYGYSMGGRLLFHLLTVNHNLFAGAFIESSHCGITDCEKRKQRVQVDEQRAAEIESGFSQFLDHWQSLPLFSSSDGQSRKYYRQIMEKNSPRMMANSLKGFGAGVMPSVCEKLHKLRLPLYLAAGELDQKYVSRMAEISELNSHFDLFVAKNAGHRVHTDRPDFVINQLKNLISSHV